MIEVTIPSHSEPEARYAVRVLLDDFLGLPYHCRVADSDDFVLSAEGRQLRIASIFLRALSDGTAEKLSGKPCQHWDGNRVGWPVEFCAPLLPVPFGKPEVREGADEIAIDIDIFGTAFFMLSRYEETLPGERDSVGRFPVRRALAYRCGFLDRPIVDEYVELLFAAMRRLWPSITRKQREFVVIPTHDVDNPFLAPKLRTATAVVARLGADIVRRRSLRLAAQTAASFTRWKMSGGQHVEGDPFNVFDWLLQQAECSNVAGRYYFMTHDEAGGPLAGRYDVAAPHVTRLIGKLAASGQEIGIHPTSESYKDAAVLNAQVMKLRLTLDRLGLDGRPLGGRQHYLRWCPDTAELYAEAGLAYDSTLAHSEVPGFRCGTSHRFPLWSFQKKAPLEVLEEPLIVMECSLLSQTYMGVEHEEAYRIVSQLKRCARKMRGRFIFLWHNDQLLSRSDRELYCHCVSGP